MRRLVPIAVVAVVALAACRTYDSEQYLASDKGLLDADQWAGYGPEQAVAVAVGREFGANTATAAAEYARKFPRRRQRGGRFPGPSPGDHLQEGLARPGQSDQGRQARR